MITSDRQRLLSVAEVLRAITSALRALFKKAPTEALLLDNYGQLCLALDEIIQEVWHHRLPSEAAKACEVTCLQMLLWSLS